MGIIELDKWTTKPLFRDTIEGTLSTDLARMMERGNFTSDTQILAEWHKINGGGVTADEWNADPANQFVAKVGRTVKLADGISKKLPDTYNTKLMPVSGGRSHMRAAYQLLMDRHDFVWLMLQDGTRKLLHMRPLLNGSAQHIYACVRHLNIMDEPASISSIYNACGLHGYGIGKRQIGVCLRDDLLPAGLLTRNENKKYFAVPTDPPIPSCGFAYGSEAQVLLKSLECANGDDNAILKGYENPARKALAKRLVSAYVRANPQADTKSLDGFLRFGISETGAVLGACMLPFALYQTLASDKLISDLVKVYGMHRDLCSLRANTQMTQAIQSGYADIKDPSVYDPDSARRPHVVMLTKGKNAPLREWWTPPQLERICNVSANPVVSSFLSWAVSDSATIDFCFQQNQE